MLVGADTNLIIYALGLGKPDRADNSEEFDLLVKRAGWWLRELEDQSARIVLPSVCLAEVLTGIPAENHFATAQEFEDRFIVAPFDVHSAILAAQLWQEHSKLPSELKLPRKSLKLDVLAIASAKASSAETFYSHDRKCINLARRIMKASDLPSRSSQLFE